MKNYVKKDSAETISTLLETLIQELDLDKAPKFYVMSHLLVKLMGKNIREKSNSKINFTNVHYLPRIKDGLNEKLFCDFLTNFASYLQSLLTADNEVHSILNELVITNKFCRNNLMKNYDVSYLHICLKLLRKAIQVVFP